MAMLHMNSYDIRIFFFGRNRITGLDPCNLDFPPSYSHHLSEKDAKFVDIIHTAIGVRGSTSTGTADFYPNGGVATQPGCNFVALNENGMPSTSILCHYSFKFSFQIYAVIKDPFSTMPRVLRTNQTARFLL